MSDFAVAATRVALAPPMGSEQGRRIGPGIRGGLARPVTPQNAALVLQVGGSLFLAGALGGFLVLLTARDLVANSWLLGAVATSAAVAGATLVAGGTLRRRLTGEAFALTAHVVLVGGPAMINVGLYAVGPSSLLPVVMHAEVPIFAFNLLPRRRAVAIVALQSLGFAAVLALRGGYVAPGAQWLFLTATLAAVGATFGGLLNRAVEETERLSRLQRFLAPQVAEAILSSGTTTQLEPHRRRIAVLFCDLRGFTRFSGGSEPEEVVEVLSEYFTAVGGVLSTCGATVGGFAGDGIMAYFNDPVPCDDPAGRAVDLALRVRPVLDEVVGSWERRGFHLGYGLGVSYGYATMGVIGFEGRNDYTPVGSVVNLASRLCGEAAPGEVLVDERTFDALGDRVAGSVAVLHVKGFAEPVTCYRLVDTPG